MSRRVFLVRHGHTAFNSAKAGDSRLRGWIDLPLDARGIKDAQAVSAKLGPLLPPDVTIFTSDLQRAVRLASILAKEHHFQRPIPTNALRPWNLGQMHGRWVSEVLPEMIRLTRAERETPPGGEPFATFRRRFLRFLDQQLAAVRVAGNPRVLVTHSRCFQAARAWMAAGAPPDLSIDTRVMNDYEREADPGAIYLIEPGSSGDFVIRELAT